MTIDRYNSQMLQDYREKIAETGRLRDELKELAERGKESGELGTAQDLLKEFSVKSQELRDIARALGPDGILLAKYGYEKINDHTALFVLPKGCSRIEILQEAQSIVKERDGRVPIDSLLLKAWTAQARFSRRIDSSESVCIQGHVEEAVGKSRGEQERLLSLRALEVPSMEDLAVAFALHWVAVGGPLFKRVEHDSYLVRPASIRVALQVYSGRLIECRLDDQDCGADVTIAARIPQESTPGAMSQVKSPKYLFLR